MAEKEFKAAVVGCVTILAEAFGRTVTKNTFQAYELGLSGLAPEQIKIATQLALEACRFMPPPAELREMLFHRGQDRAVKAWMAFEQAVTRHGYIRSVNFDDPIINATVRALGGWQACCDMPASEFDAFLPKRFQETYCSLLKTGVSVEQSAPLLGWACQQNSLNGYAQKPPVEISSGLPALPPSREAARIQSSRPADLLKLTLQKP